MEREGNGNRWSKGWIETEGREREGKKEGEIEGREYHLSFSVVGADVKPNSLSCVINYVEEKEEEEEEETTTCHTFSSGHRWKVSWHPLPSFFHSKWG